jgi:hypothetical protein
MVDFKLSKSPELSKYGVFLTNDFKQRQAETMVSDPLSPVAALRACFQTSLAMLSSMLP